MLEFKREDFLRGDFFGRGGQTRTGNPSLPKRVRYQLRHAPIVCMKLLFQIHVHQFTSFYALLQVVFWGEWWDLNPRPPEPQSGALPTELHSPSQFQTISKYRFFGLKIKSKNLAYV